MASEDFSVLLEQVPGAYFFIGQDGAYCHHPEYVFDTAVIPIGAAILADLAVSRCAAGTVAKATRSNDRLRSVRPTRKKITA
jgi:hypothetical protein